MKTDVLARLAAVVVVSLGVALSFGADSSDSGRIVSAAVDEIRVDPNSGRSLESLPLSSPDSIIVKFTPDVSAETRLRILQQSQCSISESCNYGDFHLVKITDGETPENVVSQLLFYDGVAYAELNYYVYSTFLPNDEYYALQWNLENRGTGSVHMERGWNIQQCAPQIIVAIVDTGVAYEDYEDFVQAPELAEVSFVPGYDFANEDEHPNDDHGHGTHVAGTIAQSTNNGMGVAGIAFGCSIMPVKVLDDFGSGTVFNVARGIYYAVEHGATIISMSLGSRGDSKTMRDAVAAAYEKGITCVCAAGNDGAFGNPISYPAGYDEFCIGVGHSI